MNEHRPCKRILPVLGFIGIIGLWYAASSAPGWNHFLFPSPAVVASRMVQLLENGVLFRHLGASLFRVLCGFGIAVLIAFPTGIALALLPLFSALVRPLLNFLRQIPPLAVVPLLILGFGIGEASRIAVVVMASFFPVLLNVESGIRQVDRRLLEVGRVLSFTPLALFRHVAFPTGIALALLPLFSALVRPLLNFLRQIPPLAVVPLLILGFGIGEASRIAVVVMASFFPVLLNVESGIRQVDRRLLEVGRVLSFTPLALFRHVAFPAFFPYFLVGVRLALSYSWRSLIGAEIVAASSGVGYMIREAETLSRSDTILCGVIVLGCVGALSDRALKALSERLFPWSVPEGGA